MRGRFHGTSKIAPAISEIKRIANRLQIGPTFQAQYHVGG
jgi:hypothetical protein